MAADFEDEIWVLKDLAICATPAFLAARAFFIKRGCLIFR